MYDFPETRAAHDAFWALVRDRLRDAGCKAPDGLTHGADYNAAWGAPDLVLSHICNLPYRQSLRGHVTRIGASNYGLEGCTPGFYRSFYVVRADAVYETPGDLNGATMAINGPGSQSGWGAFVLSGEHAVAPPVIVTGSHAMSIAAVAAGTVDFATIDARSFEILSEILPDTARVRVIGATPESPGMTFITRAGQPADVYLAALNAALDDIADVHRHWLGLKSVIALPDGAYDLPIPHAPTLKAA